jgi:hypothetical protein
MVRYLLERGADPTIQDKTGRDAMEIAKHLKRENGILVLHDYVYRIHFQSKLCSMKSNDVHFYFTSQ